MKNSILAISLIIALILSSQVSIAGWVISSGTKVKVPAGKYLKVDGNLKILSTASLSNEGSLSLTGDLVNDEPSFLGNGSFDFKGSSAQEISGTAVSDFGDLKISNMVNLQNDITVNSELIFNGDKLNLGNYDLQLNSGAQITGINLSTAYIIADADGMVKQEVGTSPVEFPVGNSGSYSPVFLTNNGTLDNYSVRVFSDVLDGGTTGSTIAEIDKCVNKTWVVEEDIIGGSDLELTTQWNGADEGISFFNAYCSVGQFLSAWTPSIESAAAGSDPYTQTLSGISEVGAFAMFSGFTGPVTTITTLTEQCHNGTIYVPVTVDSFNNIGGISLVMNYDETFLNLEDVVWNTAIVNGQHLEPVPGTITFSWISLTGVSLADDEVLFTLEFTYIGVDPNPTPAITDLSWDNSDPSYLEYATPDGTVLIDDPFASYYFNGSVEVMDITPPSITCPTVDPYYIVNDVCIWIATGLEPVFSDNCSVEPGLELSYSVDNGTTWTLGNANGYAFQIGDTELIYKAIDEALNENTCTLTVHVDGITVTGNVDYYNTATTSMGEDVTVKLQQGGTDYYSGTTTGGIYTFEDVCLGTYDIVSSTTLEEGGINTTDAAQVNFWSVNNSSIQAVRFYAGDVNSSNSVLSDDASQIQQYFLTLGNPGVPFATDWTFWNVDEFISSNAGASGGYPQITVTNVSETMTNDLYAMVTGDFNSSFTPGAKAPESETLILVNGDDLQVGAGEFELPITTGVDMHVGAISMIIDVPADLLEVQGVYFGNNPNELVPYMVAGDELRISWHSLNPVNLPKDDVLLILKLNPTGTNSEPITLTLVPNPLNELADDAYQVIDDAVLVVDVIHTTMTGFSPNNAGDQLEISSQPNPFRQSTNFVYTIPASGKVVIELYDIVGNKVATVVDEFQDAGEHKIKFDTELQPGVYTALLVLETNDDVQTRTIKIINK